MGGRQCGRTLTTERHSRARYFGMPQHDVREHNVRDAFALLLAVLVLLLGVACALLAVGALQNLFVEHPDNKPGAYVAFAALFIALSATFFALGAVLVASVVRGHRARRQ